MSNFVYFPDPSEEPPVDSRFFYVERRDKQDSPEMVYLWARAVLRQVDRYRGALATHERLQLWDRHEEDYVHSDAFLEVWCDERTELHFLMESAVQMYRWATVPDPNDKAWEARRLLYEIPGAATGRWVKTLRDALVHFDEAYRGVPRSRATVEKAEHLVPDVAAIAEAATYLINACDPSYEP